MSKVLSVIGYWPWERAMNERLFDLLQPIPFISIASVAWHIGLHQRSVGRFLGLRNRRVGEVLWIRELDTRTATLWNGYQHFLDQ